MPPRPRPRGSIVRRTDAIGRPYFVHRATGKRASVDAYARSRAAVKAAATRAANRERAERAVHEHQAAREREKRLETRRKRDAERRRQQKSQKRPIDFGGGGAPPPPPFPPGVGPTGVGIPIDEYVWDPDAAGYEPFAVDGQDETGGTK